MSTDQIILIASSIATWVTAVIILFTLREMARQRRDAIKPEIVPVRQSVFAQKDPHATFNAPIFWLTGMREEDEKTENYGRYSVKLFNLGNGAAKNIKASWSFPLEEFVEHINSISSEEKYRVAIGTKELLGMTVFQNDSAVQSINLELEQKRDYDYLLPAPIESTGLLVQFPFSYKTLFSLYSELIYDEPRGTGAEKTKEDYSIPPLQLKISYEDINGKKYHAVFKFIITITAIFPSKNDGIGFHGTLDYT